MNCHEFESKVVEIGREQLHDARTLRAAEDHVADCASCARILSDVRALTTGLSVLSTNMSHGGASANVEANLLATFRQNYESASVDKTASFNSLAPNVVPLVEVRQWSWWKTIGVAGLAAAAAIALFMIVPPGLVPPPSTTKEDIASRGTKEDSVAPPASQQGIVSISPDDTTVPVSVPVGVPPSKSQRPQDRRLMAVASLGNARRDIRTSPAVNAAYDSEITTEFIPIAQGGVFVRGEGAHVMRVELPRSALTRFGLPVNADSANGRVKADVVVGEDGVARAIRFVR